jgi:hypothetical protein
MGIPVLILGKTGSGKSTSLRSFQKGQIGIFNVASKPLPFRNKNELAIISNAGYETIERTLHKNTLKCYAIDDSQYLMAFEMFSKAKVKGYDKYTELALNFYNLIQMVIKGTSEDTIVYFLHHTDLADDGSIKAKTVGKMLDEKLSVEGLFSIVIGCSYTENGYKFITHTSGNDTIKTPMEMFEEKYIDNDLLTVDRTIRAYYGYKEENNEQTK